MTPRGFLTERLETSVDVELAAWVNEKAAREERKPAAIVRRALRVYRDLEQAREQGFAFLAQHPEFLAALDRDNPGLAELVKGAEQKREKVA